MCEQMQPGWLTTLGPPLYSVFNPSGDNSVVCTNFTPTAGQTVTFTINNLPAAGRLGIDHRLLEGLGIVCQFERPPICSIKPCKKLPRPESLLDLLTCWAAAAQACLLIAPRRWKS
jgi:hypothetical protein